MDEDAQTTWAEILAILSMVFGLILEFAPFLLAGIAPPLATTSPIVIGTFSIPANLLYGVLFIGGGALLFFYYQYWRGD